VSVDYHMEKEDRKEMDCTYQAIGPQEAAKKKM
jgi:hypothetical protein